MKQLQNTAHLLSFDLRSQRNVHVSCEIPGQITQSFAINEVIFHRNYSEAYYEENPALTVVCDSLTATVDLVRFDFSSEFHWASLVLKLVRVSAEDRCWVANEMSLGLAMVTLRTSEEDAPSRPTPPSRDGLRRDVSCLPSRDGSLIDRDL